MDGNLVAKIVGWLTAYSPISLRRFEHGIGTLLALSRWTPDVWVRVTELAHDKKISEILAARVQPFHTHGDVELNEAASERSCDPSVIARCVAQLTRGTTTRPRPRVRPEGPHLLNAEAPKVLMDVLMEEKRYRLATYLVDEHRRLAIATAGKAGSGRHNSQWRPRHEADFSKLSGPAALKQMPVITTAIITNFDENLEALRAAFVAPRRAIRGSQVAPTKP